MFGFLRSSAGIFTKGTDRLLQNRSLWGRGKEMKQMFLRFSSAVFCANRDAEAKATTELFCLNKPGIAESFFLLSS